MSEMTPEGFQAALLKIAGAIYGKDVREGIVYGMQYVSSLADKVDMTQQEVLDLLEEIQNGDFDYVTEEEVNAAIAEAIGGIGVIKEIEYDINDIQETLGLSKSRIPEYTSESGRIDPDGTIGTSTGHRVTSPIYIEAGSTISWTAGCSPNLGALGKASTENSTVWTRVLSGKNEISRLPYSVTVDENCYVRISYYANTPIQDLAIRSSLPDTGLIIDVSNARNDINENTSNISDLFEEIGKETTTNITYLPADYDDTDKLIPGYIYSNDGHFLITDSTFTYRRTFPIAVTKNDKITFRCRCQPETAALAFSTDPDATNWSPIVKGSAPGSLADYSTIIPEDGYIIFSFRKLDTPGLIPFTGTIRTYSSDGIVASINELRDRLNVFDTDKPIRTSVMKSFGDQPLPDGSDESFCDIRNHADSTYANLLNDVYEPLRTAYPNYVSRQLIGKDASNTYDMYAYVFTPKYYTQHVYINAGVHANETMAIAALARIMQLITTNPNNDPDLAYVRQNVKFSIIPCVNVWGFNQNPKKNVNANNVAPSNWYSATPIQEIENIKNFLSGIDKNLSFGFDWHGSGAGYPDLYAVIIPGEKNNRTVCRANAWAMDTYGVHPSTYPYGNNVGYNNTTTFFRNGLYDFLKIPVTTCEFNPAVYNPLSANGMKIGVDFYLNHLIQQINDGYNYIANGIPEENDEWHYQSG